MRPCPDTLVRLQFSEQFRVHVHEGLACVGFEPDKFVFDEDAASVFRVVELRPFV